MLYRYVWNRFEVNVYSKEGNSRIDPTNVHEYVKIFGTIIPSIDMVYNEPSENNLVIVENL